ncbi:chitinase [Nemania sp. FL0031]|nr:chitinase [Nemania sp. FL0031]
MRLTSSFPDRDDCVSTCDRKSQCIGPGWGTDKYSEFDKCPLNVCCSEHGFCGTTDEFCGDDNQVDRPSCSVGDTPIDRVIGYYEAWSTDKRSCYGMLPEEIPYGYYTHLIFSFAAIDPETYEISPGGSQTADFMNRIGSIKMIQPDIEIWVAVGGWAFNDPGPNQLTFSEIAASKENTDKFISSLIKMMNTYGFDGIDIDWEYPAAEDRGGREEDFDNFVTFLERVRKSLSAEGRKKGISLTLPSSYWYMQHFDIKSLEEHVDWFNLMSYDIHGSWDIDNEWTGPLLNAHTNLTEIQTALDLLWRNDINPKKVVLGMAYYSRSFTLVDSGCSRPGCLVASGGNAGECSATTGVLLHPEIQDIIKEHNLTPTLDREAAVKMVNWGDQWASFDDAATWRIKANLARSQCISGVMVWAISQDDTDNTNAKALTTALGREVMDFPNFDPPQPVIKEPVESAELCRWSGCYQGCPSGFKEVPRDGTNQIMGDGSNCLADGFSKFCCPANQPLPTCLWRGHHNSGICTPGCEDDEVEVGTLRTGCNISHQSACCKDTSTTAQYGDCRWQGSSPSCDIGSGCGGDFPYELVKTSTGAGGEQPCVSGQKKLCCRNPRPNAFAGTCKWVTKGSPPRFEQPLICEDSCPEGQIKVATMVDNYGDCFGGAKAFCCEPVKVIVPRGPDDDDPFGGGQGEQFRTLIQKYMENPTCPATILEVPLHDYFTSPMPAQEKRDESLLVGRATDCTIDTWTLLLSFAAVMFTQRSTSLDPFREVWDDEFAGAYDDAYEFDWLNDFWHMFPAIDIHSLLEHVLYNPLQAGVGLRQRQHAREVFCDLSTARQVARDSVIIRLNETLKDRAIDAWGRNINIPSLQTILEGINNNDLEVFYARWQYQSGSGRGGTAGPLLEIAYRIPQGQAGDPYRDPRFTFPEDQYVVFHFHINANNPYLQTIEEETYIGVEALRVYHGYQIRTFNNFDTDFRVDNREDTTVDDRNVRDGLDCGDIGDGLWYVGDPRADIQNDWDTTFHTWARGLHENGYLATQGVSTIHEGADYPLNQIDPNQPGQLTRPGGTSTELGGVDPYRVNWVILFGQFVRVPNP